MFTPQQIEQISFGRSTFGGYDMQQVDEFLEPLTEDYVALYKENALLKSKMRVLVGKLEEYRKNEASMKEAVANAQRTCDKMVHEAEAKCAQMLSSANAAAAAAPAAAVQAAPAVSGNADALVAAENARVDEARKVAVARINEIQDQMRTCVQALERIKEANAVPGAAERTARAAAQAAPQAPAAAPAAPQAPVQNPAPAAAPAMPQAPAPRAPQAGPARRPAPRPAQAPVPPMARPAAPQAAPAPQAPAAPAPQSVDSDLVAEEIAQNLEALVGTTEDHAPKAAPRHPVNDSTTSKFASLNLQFGRNYDPRK